MRVLPARRAAAAPFALFTGFGALFALGVVTAALAGRLPAVGVLIGAAAIVAIVSALSEPRTAPLMAAIGWLTAVGFSRPPYAQLRPSGPLAAHAAAVMAVTALTGAAAGVVHRSGARHILDGVGDRPSRKRPDADESGDTIDARRRLLGLALALTGLPLLSLALQAARPYLTLTDDLLIYLVAVVGLAVVGGFWPAVLAAIAASMLLNWFFTPPVHTFTIDKPQNLLALLLFVTVAVMVSSVVHLAARRAGQAARSRQEAASLLALAQTVLGGSDTPSAVLSHLTSTLGGRAELLENVGGRWVRIAASRARGEQAAVPSAIRDRAGPPAASPGAQPPGGQAARIAIREGLALEVADQDHPVPPGLLAGFAAQSAAALDRERLRTQAAQAEALAEGNRMRTALLAAVSHDLRTPLASVKASVSSLRQTDVEWSEEDRADLLATIERSADRLDGLIGNLLDMSRIHTGSLQPFLRSTTAEEVAPAALRGLDDGVDVVLAIPDGLPLVLADPGLLERVLANLFANALRHSPPGRPPWLRARQTGGAIALDVVDHGPGVPDDLKERIFEPFQRFDGRKSGVGLGLAVVKGFTEAMGGAVSAADTPGGGLTVSVVLPAAETGASAEAGVRR